MVQNGNERNGTKGRNRTFLCRNCLSVNNILIMKSYKQIEIFCTPLIPTNCQRIWPLKLSIFLLVVIFVWNEVKQTLFLHSLNIKKLFIENTFNLISKFPTNVLHHANIFVTRKLIAAIGCDCLRRSTRILTAARWYEAILFKSKNSKGNAIN